MNLRRTVTAEALDHLGPEQPAARRSRRDLARIHRAMGTRSIVLRGWQALLPPERIRNPLRILELGAGDGTLLLGVAQRMASRWPQVHLCLLDRQDIVSPATLRGYAQLGWDVRVERADALDWAARSHAATSGESEPRWDLISTTLFLHHFDGDPLDMLLAAVAARGVRFFACEPRRAWRALAGSHLVGAIGANAVTRGDAVLSVRAGFRGREISERWGHALGPWETREFAAGLFSHCFSATRTGAQR